MKDKKLVVVTGAAGVLCGMFASHLAHEGYKVALLDINYDAAKILSDKLNEEGCVTKAYKVNVLEKDSIESAHQEILKDFGCCDILINGAGGNNPKGTTSNEYFNKEDVLDPSTVSFFDLDPDGIQFVFNLNFLGVLLPTQVFAKDFIENEKGNIVNISSMNAFTPLTKIPAYSGAKAAVSNFTQWLAVHFAQTGIRVNAIAPGFFVTNQNKALLFNEDGTPTPRTGKIIAGTPMRRFGEPEELLGTLNYLIDDNASSFVTGVIIPVDGGYNAYSGV